MLHSGLVAEPDKVEDLARGVGYLFKHTSTLKCTLLILIKESEWDLSKATGTQNVQEREWTVYSCVVAPG